MVGKPTLHDKFNAFSPLFPKLILAKIYILIPPQNGVYTWQNTVLVILKSLKD